MRTLMAMIVGFVIIGATSVTAIAFRPAYVMTVEQLNATMYDQVVDAGARSFWDTFYSVADYLYWILPSMLIIGVIIMVWINAQQKEYVTGGYYG